MLLSLSVQRASLNLIKELFVMNLTSGVIEIDLHGIRAEEAVRRAKSEVAKASRSVYIIRLIHGYHGGTRIREALKDTVNKKK